MLTLVIPFLASLFKSQRQLVLENLALRQQITMLRQSVKRPRATMADKLFWIFFSRYVDSWRQVLHDLHPDTVMRWHRQGYSSHCSTSDGYCVIVAVINNHTGNLNGIK